jgi:hypothetical protein
MKTDALLAVLLGLLSNAIWDAAKAFREWLRK